MVCASYDIRYKLEAQKEAKHILNQACELSVQMTKLKG